MRSDSVVVYSGKIGFLCENPGGVLGKNLSRRFLVIGVCPSTQMNVKVPLIDISSKVLCTTNAF